MLVGGYLPEDFDVCGGAGSHRKFVLPWVLRRREQKPTAKERCRGYQLGAKFLGCGFNLLHTCAFHAELRYRRGPLRAQDNSALPIFQIVQRGIKRRLQIVDK